MNLRNAAERVWVLNVDLWSLDYVAALEKFPETGSCLDLSLMRTYCVNLMVKRLDSAVVCFKRKGSDLVCPVGQPLCLWISL